jgi:hypothetical protein
MATTTSAAALRSLKSSLLLQTRLANRHFHSTTRRAEQFLQANEEVHAALPTVLQSIV